MTHPYQSRPVAEAFDSYNTAALERCSYRIVAPIPIRPRPPRISARLPAIAPINRPTITPRDTISMVAQPIAMAVTTILLSMKARPTPTAMASILVANPVAASSQKEWRVTGCSSSDSLQPLRIIMAPRTQSMTKAIQWSHCETYCAATEPNAHPTTGVIASMTPNIRPVRRASDSLGLCKAAPFPTAAAKASVDIAKAKTSVDSAFIVKLLHPDEIINLAMSSGDGTMAKFMVSPSRSGRLHHDRIRWVKNVDTGPSRYCRKEATPQKGNPSIAQAVFDQIENSMRNKQ